MKRRLLVLVVCLMLGALTTIAVAWGLGYFIRYEATASAQLAVKDDPITVDPLTGDRMGPAGIHLLRFRGFGAEEAVVQAIAWTLLDDPVPDRPALAAIWPAWGPLRWRSPQDVFDELHANAEALGIETLPLGYAARGWPMLALWCEFDNGHGMARGAFDVGMLHTPGTFISTRQVLRWRPDPIGFAIDTFFYGAIWFAVIFGFLGAKRFVRIRRGRCPRCGYDLRGQRIELPHPNPLPRGEGGRAGCPECGWGREREVDSP